MSSNWPLVPFESCQVMRHVDVIVIACGPRSASSVYTKPQGPGSRVARLESGIGVPRPSQTTGAAPLPRSKVVEASVAVVSAQTDDPIAARATYGPAASTANHIPRLTATSPLGLT